MGCALHHEALAFGSVGSTLNIYNSTFQNHIITANNTRGGAIYSFASMLAISGSKFINNQAFYGAALYVTSVDASSFTISDTLFDHNVAMGSGSAAFTEQSVPGFTWPSSIKFSANSGLLTASLPVSVNVANFPSVFYPGNAVSVGSAVLDSFNNPIQLSLDGTDKSSQVVSVIMQSDYPCFVDGQNVYPISTGGVFTASRLSFGGPLGAHCVASVVKNGFILGEIDFKMSSTCLPGYYFTDGECVQCPRGAYNLDGVSACLECPSGATCEGGAVVNSKKNWYKNVEGNKVKMYECDLENCAFEAPCASTCLADNKCGSHYTGVLCAECTSGYEKLNGKCVDCPGTNGGVVVFTIIYVVVVLLLLFSLHSYSFGFLKLFFDFFQVCDILVDFSYMSLFSFDFSEFPFSITNTCIGPQDFKSRFLTSILSPLIWALALIVMAPLWAVFLRIRSRKVSDASGYAPAAWTPALWRSLQQTCLFLLLQMYAPITSTVLDFFALRKVGNDYYLASDSSIRTDRDQYTSMMPLAVIWMIIWVVGVPVALAVWMWSVRGYLWASVTQNTNGGSGSVRKHYVEEEKMPAQLRRMQMMFLTYKPRWFCWDLVLLLRRLVLLIFTRRWYGYSTGIRLLMGVLVCICYLFLQFFTKPFLRYRVNKLESISAVCLVVVAVIYENVPVQDRLDDTDSLSTNLAFRIIIAMFFLSWCVSFVVWLVDKVRKVVMGVSGAKQEKQELNDGGEQAQGTAWHSSLLSKGNEE
jgi:hypothetical protein